ncbi:MAG: hypothetical protein AB1413_05520 [Thermodesulfobacteriota bacterium]
MRKKLLMATLLTGILTAGTAAAQTGHAGHGGPPAADGKATAAQPAAPAGHGKMGHGMMGGGMGGMMGGGMGGGMGCGMMGGGMGKGIADELGPEEQQKYLDATRELRKKLHDRQFEYGEAARNPKTTRAELLKKKKEVWDLQQKLHEKAWEFMK